MARHYGMPYMGSKQKLVDKIIPFILERHKDTTDFYDLFGGGASVSLYVVRKYPKLKVHYNELSKAISGLLTYIQEGGKIPTDFVGHKEFDIKKHGHDWYAGLLQTCWCFGNNQTSYLYGKDIEQFKHKYHDTVITGKDNLKWLSEFVEGHSAIKGKAERPTKLYLDFKRYNTPYQRRIVLNRQLPYLSQLEHLSRIERLVQIQNMPGLKALEITSGLSYKDVEVGGWSPLVYCDPPYEGTAGYKEGGFNHKEFYDWVATRDYPVYFSSYKITDERFTIVKAINTRSLISHSDRATGGQYNFENLYWNGKS